MGVPAKLAGSGIIGFSYAVSDDGRWALVELVACDRTAFSSILTSRDPNVRTFEKGKARKEDVEREFKRLRADFDWNRFQVRGR